MLLEINAVMQLTCGERDRNNVQADLRDAVRERQLFVMGQAMVFYGGSGAFVLCLLLG